MSPEEEALEAKRILDNPAFQSALARVKGNYFSEWVDSKWFQFRKREYIYKQIKSVVEVEAELQEALHSGLMAAKNRPKGDS